jgi:hypothetical protein
MMDRRRFLLGVAASQRVKQGRMNRQRTAEERAELGGAPRT